MKKSIVFGVILVVLFTTISAFAAYPDKSVTIVCPWGAGGGTDRVARFLAAELEKEYGKPFTVVNKTGGGGAVGHGAGAYAKPDGYTLTLVTLEIANMHWLGLTELTYEDLDYVIQVNEDPSCVIVKADAPWHSITELLVDIAMHPGEYMFSGSSAGSIWDLSRIGLLDKVGVPVDYVKWIPTKGAAPSIVELLGGHVDVITCSAPEASAQLDSGQLRALAIMADERNPKYSDVPTLKELGIDWSSGTWRGIAVPKETPEEVVNSLYGKLSKITNSEKYKDFMSKNGFGIKIRSSEEFSNFVEEQNTTWKKILKIGGYLK